MWAAASLWTLAGLLSAEFGWRSAGRPRGRLVALTYLTIVVVWPVLWWHVFKKRR